MTKATTKGSGKKNIMREFSIEEISGVDRPAQEGAKVVIMKRKQPNSGLGYDKKAALTTAENEHTHVFSLHDYDGREQTFGETSYENGHSHPWVRTEEGDFVIGEVQGHAHGVAVMSKQDTGESGQVENRGDDSMATKETAKNEAENQEPTVESLQAELAEVKETLGKRDEIIDQLTADLAKAKEDASVEKSTDAEVVYKANDGREFTKADDARFVAEVKRADEAEKVNKRNLAVEKARTQLGNLSGDLETKADILEAVEGISDVAKRDAALTVLKSHNEAFKGVTDTVGETGENIQKDEGPEAELDALVAKHREANPDVTEAAAFAAVLKTDAGAQIYGKMRG